MTELEVRFRGDLYKVNYDMEAINWIVVYIIFVQEPYLINLIRKNYFHVLQVTNETKNIYWFSSQEGHDKDANEFKRIVADALRVKNGELI
jgi:hypothetical protein